MARPLFSYQKFWKLLFIVILQYTLAVILHSESYAGTDESYAKDPKWQEAVESTIQRYLRTHPEVVVEAFQAIEAKRKLAETDHLRKQIAAHHVELLKDPTSPTSGNPKGDVTVVEFFDYRCVFCKQAAGALTQLQTEDKNIRVVYKDFPILGDLSIQASKAALAARAQGKHQQFHEALLASHNEITWEEIATIATRTGLDVRKLETDMQAPEIQAILNRNRALGADLGISGTPGFIVGTELKPGALELNELKELVGRARTIRAKGGRS